MLPGMVPVICSSRRDASRVFKGLLATSPGGTTATLTHNGGVRTGKWIVGVGARSSSSGVNADPTSVTLNGAALTKVVGQAASAFQNASLWISPTDITTSGSDAVVMTFAVSQNQVASSLYAVDLLGTTPTATGTSSGGLSVNVSAGGLIIGANANGGPTTETWTGLTKDDAVSSSKLRFGSASAEFAAAATPRTVSVSHGSTETAAVTASFR